MKNKNINKLIVISLLVSVILNFCFLLKEYNHDCTHTPDCPICVLIHQAEDNLKGLGLGFSSLIIFSFFLYNFEVQKTSKKIFYKKDLTLVELKAQLNN